MNNQQWLEDYNKPQGIILRPYQHQAIEQARQSIKAKKKRPIIAAPTGSGKTIMAAAMLKSCQDNGKKGWFFMDRKQLIEQTIEKFTQMGLNFGVRQANHELHNPEAPIQIASIQTIQAMIFKHKKILPEFDMCLVDECDTHHKVIQHVIDTYNNIPIIGLTATPYSKGLGLRYNNLIIPITQAQLLIQGDLCPVKYFGGEHIDLSKIRSVNPNTYSAQDLEQATDKDADRLTGCIVRNWMEYGENAQTIAFSPSQALSKTLVERLNANGISAEHIDCNFSQEEREDLFEAHDKGEFKVLSCSRLLNTGYDAPSVRCIIDCYPTKSVTTYVQRVGRLMRPFEGKEYAVILDHAGNFDKFGYAEDIIPESLHDGTTTHNEKDQIKEGKKESKTRDCPQCYQQMKGIRCKACGYEVPKSEQMEDDGSMLVELTGSKANRKDSREIKEQFLSELQYHGRTKGYKPGWAANQYREKYSVWPSKINPHKTDKLSDMTKGWLKHMAIRRIHSLKKEGKLQ